MPRQCFSRGTAADGHTPSQSTAKPKLTTNFHLRPRPRDLDVEFCVTESYIPAWVRNHMPSEVRDGIIFHFKISTAQALISGNKEVFSSHKSWYVWSLTQALGLVPVHTPLLIVIEILYKIMHASISFPDPQIRCSVLTRVREYKHCNSLNWHGLTLISAWISNHMTSKVWGEITNPSPNFNRCTAQVITWHFIKDVMTYPCWD